MRRSFKYRIYLNKAQEEALNTAFYMCRTLYNSALEERISSYKKLNKFISYKQQSAYLPEIKESFKEENKFVYAQSLQYTLKTLDNAYKGFFSRCKSGKTPGFPRYKSYLKNQSICFPQCNMINGGVKLLQNQKLKIYGIPGEVKIILHRPWKGDCKTVQIKKQGDEYYLILSCNNVEKNILEKTGKTVGIDLGITNFITTDDGTKFHHPKAWRTSKEKLAFKQRKLSCQKRGSKNRLKTIKSLRKTHNKIVNQRDDWQHKMANHLVRTYDNIVIEDLNVKGMLEAKGFDVSKGNISDASFGNFVSKLTYKAESADKLLIKVNPRNTSKTCSCCGNVKKDLSILCREYLCDQCGISIDRDINAAKNILVLGTSLMDFNNPRSLSL